MSRALEATEFIQIKYRIILRNETKEVEGFAFETPGWPEWRACVRWGCRYGADIFCDWIVDHYDTGMALSGVGRFDSKAEAPAAMAAFLETKGREEVHNRLREYGCAPAP